MLVGNEKLKVAGDVVTEPSADVKTTVGFAKLPSASDNSILNWFVELKPDSGEKTKLTWNVLNDSFAHAWLKPKFGAPITICAFKFWFEKRTKKKQNNKK